MNIGSTLKAAKNVVTSKAGIQVLKTQKHSPVILFSAGVVGFGATVFLASKATLKLEPILAENERKQGEAHDLHELNKLGKEDYSAKDYKKDVATLKVRMVRDVAGLYAPALAVGTLSVCALTGSHVILTKRNTGLMAAYATLDQSFKEYQKRVTERFGPDADRELKHGVDTVERAVDTDEGTRVDNVRVHAGASQYAKLFAKDTTQEWSPQPEYNFFFLKSNQSWANDQLRAHGHLFLNDVYKQLGLSPTPAGQMVGWVWNNKNGGDNFVDFGIFDNPDRFHDFIVGNEGALLLDFNVDGVVYGLI